MLEDNAEINSFKKFLTELCSKLENPETPTKLLQSPSKSSFKKFPHQIHKQNKHKRNNFFKPHNKLKRK
jgi:hypothetical protein